MGLGELKHKFDVYRLSEPRSSRTSLLLTVLRILSSINPQKDTLAATFKNRPDTTAERAQRLLPVLEETLLAVGRTTPTILAGSFLP